MQAFCHLCLIFCVLGRTILELGGEPWESTNSPRSLVLPGLYHMRFFWAHIWTRVMILHFCLVFSSKGPELCHLMVTAAKAAPDLHVPDWLFLVSKCDAQNSIFASWLLDHLHWDVVINAFQKFSGLFMSHYIIPSAAIRVCKHEVSSSYLKDSSCVSYPTTCR